MLESINGPTFTLCCGFSTICKDHRVCSTVCKDNGAQSSLTPLIKLPVSRMM